MRAELLSRLTPLEVSNVRLAGGTGFAHVARLLTAPHLTLGQRVHATGVWLVQYDDKLIRLMGDGEMAKKTDTSRGKFEFKGFVNLRLNEDDKAAIMADERGLSSVFEDVGGLMYRGYKVSLSWDVYSGAVQATLTCMNPDCANYGYAISARNPDPVIALNSLLYKHFEKAGEVWSSVQQAFVDRAWD